MPTRVKMCAMTRPEDAQFAARLGVDAIGLIFYEKSSRFVTIDQAREIIGELAPFVTVVGVFVDALPEYIDRILTQVPLDMLQFHGDETPEECDRYQRPYLKLIRMKADQNVKREMDQYPNARGFILDTHDPDLPGGTGKKFDWNRIPKDLDQPIILAGGLTPENVASAIAHVKPYAVDVVSGIESMPGIKDPDKMSAFMQAVRSVEK